MENKSITEEEKDEMNTLDFERRGRWDDSTDPTSFIGIKEDL